jgi:hypothetical protein
MNELERRVNGSVAFADLPTGLEHPMVLEQMDNPTAFTPTVCAVGLMVNLVVIRAAAAYAMEAVTARIVAR